MALLVCAACSADPGEPTVGTDSPILVRDLMAYCTPRWVGGYHYAKMVQWVQFAQSWSSERSARASEPASPRVPPHTCFDPHAIDSQ